MAGDSLSESRPFFYKKYKKEELSLFFYQKVCYNKYVLLKKEEADDGA